MKSSTPAFAVEFEFKAGDRTTDGQLFVDVDLKVSDRNGVVQGTCPMARILKERDKLMLVTRTFEYVDGGFDTFGEVKEHLHHAVKI